METLKTILKNFSAQNSKETKRARKGLWEFEVGGKERVNENFMLSSPERKEIICKVNVQIYLISELWLLFWKMTFLERDTIV